MLWGLVIILVGIGVWGQTYDPMTFRANTVRLNVNQSVTASGNVRVTSATLNVTADGFMYRFLDGGMGIHGGVSIHDGRIRIEGDRFFAWNDLRSISGDGGVQIHHPDFDARADRLTFTDYQDLKLYDHAILKQSGSQITGNELFYNIRTGELVIYDQAKLILNE